MIKTHNGISYLFFWGGPFSNWYPSYFTINGTEYNCVEQYMMQMKALTFGDEVTARKIMNTEEPSSQKKLGRKVIGFIPQKWDLVKYEIVKEGVRQKYLQNPDLMEYLQKRRNHQMVEASPYDRIWGIGYSDTDAIENFDDWGENLLGKIHTELAKDLTNE